MKLRGIYNRNSYIIAYTNNRVYSCNLVVDLKNIVVEYLKIKDKLFFLGKNLYSILVTIL